jgi:mRNA interferase MazF
VTFRAKSQTFVYVPNRGDVIHTDFSPSAGSETTLKHFAVVLTPKAYNEKIGRAIVVPITSKVKGFPFDLPLGPLPPQLPAAGEIMTDQVRALDLRVRGSSYAGHVDEVVLRDIVDLLFELVEPQE